MKSSTFYTLLLMVLMFSFWGTSSHAQERTVSGVVTTFDSIPLASARIKVLSTKAIVLTDGIGNFEISCFHNDKIKVSAKGFQTQSVRINEKTKIVLVNLKLKPSPKSLKIAVGYGHINEKDKLYAISTLKNENEFFSQFTNIYELIQGRFPGVRIINGEIIVRGLNSINSSNSALIVVDGVVVDQGILSTLIPSTIESIDILKDGSGAMYGSRGANGVVIINTKQGGS